MLDLRSVDTSKSTGDMGNVQSLTRTTGALDSFVAELGGDIVYERRY